MSSRPPPRRHSRSERRSRCGRAACHRARRRRRPRDRQRTGVQRHRSPGRPVRRAGSAVQGPASASRRRGRDASVLEGVGVPGRAALVDVGHVQRALVRRQRDAVGRAQILDQQLERAVAAQYVHATERQLARRIVEGTRQSEWRIREVQVAIAGVDGIVRTVEAATAVAIHERGTSAVVLQAADAAIAVLAQHEPACGVEGQSVGARLSSGEGSRAAVAARTQELAVTHATLPAVDGVGRDVRVQQRVRAPVPDRAFDPAMTARNRFEPRIPRNQCVETRIQAHELPGPSGRGLRRSGDLQRYPVQPVTRGTGKACGHRRRPRRSCAPAAGAAIVPRCRPSAE